MLAKGFVRWIITVLIITAAVTTLWAYSHETVLSSEQKRVFYMITTGLLLILNINMQVSGKGGPRTRRRGSRVQVANVAIP